MGLAAPPDPTATQPYQPRTDALVMQVLAHPDDDLFFMNPDTLHSLQPAVPVVSVYVTAGESTGVNKLPFGPRKRRRHDPPRTPPPATRGCARRTRPCWGRPVHPVAGRGAAASAAGHAEVDSLEHRAVGPAGLPPLSMREIVPARNLGLPHSGTGPCSVRAIAPGAPSPAGAARPLHRTAARPTCSPRCRTYRPTLIRTLDPDPDVQVHDTAHPRPATRAATPTTADHTASGAVHLDRDGPVGSDRVRRDDSSRLHHRRLPRLLQPPLALQPPARTVALKAGFLMHTAATPAGMRQSGRLRRLRPGPANARNPKGWYAPPTPAIPAGSRLVVADGRRWAADGLPVLGTRAVRRAETGRGQRRLGHAAAISAAGRWPPRCHASGRGRRRPAVRPAVRPR